ncbi:MAG: NAD(P)H-dependent oxidoreductase [Selenomonadaceae bacterium]|nr:NAD(P)H-dependent oxidoreductase [Selenomonadaceae bacterium]
MSKKLVAFFSASGRTRKVSQTLAEVAGADLFEIEPVQKYSGADLNWNNSNSRSSVEMNDPNSRPEIKNQIANLNDYDTIFIGFPIWWYVAPHIILTFLESYDFSDKTIIPFATSGGSGIGKTEDQLRGVASNSVNWKPMKMLNRVSESELKNWISSLGI